MTWNWTKKLAAAFGAAGIALAATVSCNSQYGTLELYHYDDDYEYGYFDVFFEDGYYYDDCYYHDCYYGDYYYDEWVIFD